MVNKDVKDGLYYLMPISFGTKALLTSGVYYFEKSTGLVPSLLERSVSMGGTVGFACFHFDARSGIGAGIGFDQAHLRIEREMNHQDLEKINEYYQQKATDIQNGIFSEGFCEEDKDYLLKDYQRGMRSVELLKSKYFEKITHKTL